MLTPAARRQLHSFRDRLHRWETEVSQDAAAFHQARADLLDQADEALRYFGALASGDSVELIDQGLQNLEALAPNLARLFARKVEVEEAIAKVLTDAEALHDEDITHHLHARRAQWRAALVRYGAHVRRPAELTEDLAEIEHVSVLVQETRGTLALLIEASRRRDELVDDPMALAPLAARFDGWKLQFRQEGATTSLMAEIDECLTPLRLRSTRKVEEAPVASLSAVKHLIFLADRWSAAHHSSGAFQVEELERDLVRIESAWPTADLTRLQELEERARSFVEAAHEQGQVVRGQILARLHDWLRHLRAASGSRSGEDDVARELDEMTATAVETPDNFVDWLDRSASVEHLFTSLATSRRPDLVNLLVERLTASLDQVAGIGIDQLTDALQVDLKMIETRLVTVRKAASEYDLEHLFKALSHVDQDVRAIEEIRQRGESDRRALEARRTREIERYQRLRTAAIAVEVEAPDLRQALTTVLTDGRAFDLAAAHLSELEQQITALTEAFFGHCHAELHEILAACTEHGQVLSHITSSPDTPPPSLEINAEHGPAAAAATLSDARRRRTELSAKLEGEARRLDRQRDQALAEMEEWFSAPDALAPGDRAAAEELRRELSLPADTASLPGVRALFDLLARHDSLHERVRSDQVVTRRRAKRLARRLEALADDGLTQFDPASAGRCFALIDAIPFASHQWPLIKGQIEEAARLLDQLEKQGRRLAARDIELACAALTREAHSDPVEARRVSQVLAELQSFLDERTLPPLALRGRVLRLAEGLRDTADA